MKNNSFVFLSEHFQFLEVKFSIFLNGQVFVMEPSHLELHCLLVCGNERVKEARHF